MMDLPEDPRPPGFRRVTPQSSNAVRIDAGENEPAGCRPARPGRHPVSSAKRCNVRPPSYSVAHSLTRGGIERPGSLRCTRRWGTNRRP